MFRLPLWIKLLVVCQMLCGGWRQISAHIYKWRKTTCGSVWLLRGTYLVSIECETNIPHRLTYLCAQNATNLWRSLRCSGSHSPASIHDQSWKSQSKTILVILNNILHEKQQQTISASVLLMDMHMFMESSNSTTAILTNMKLCGEMNSFTLTNNVMFNSVQTIWINIQAMYY